MKGLFAAKDLYCIPVLFLLFLYWNISSVIRQIGESQDGRNEKTKHSKCLLFGKFGVLC